MHRTLITATELKTHIEDENWAVFDCRHDLSNPTLGRMNYESAHIPGAVYVDITSDLSDKTISGRGRHPLPSGDAICKLFGRLGIARQTQVVVYDQAEAASAARLWWMLRYIGHYAVCVLDGGFQGWLKENYPTRSGWEERTPTKFTGVPDEKKLISVNDVLGVGLLIDSRDPKRYRGEIETIDPVAGHIPGAMNRFFKLNVTQDGYFRPKEELRRDFESLFVGEEPSRAGFYCGSGVTACHNILAAVHAGFEESRLYAGSWSEWCSDPGRPVEKA